MHDDDDDEDDLHFGRGLGYGILLIVIPWIVIIWGINRLFWS